MIKKWFSFNGNGAPSNGLSGAGPNHATGPMERDAEADLRSGRSPSPAPPPPKPASFEQIYQSAAAKPPQICYGIPKVMEMADSPHLSGMTPEAKRGALFMALEAAGAQIEDLLQDAVVRQRALNDYEERQQERLRDFEVTILEENRGIQAELDRATGQYMARIQANVDHVACQQDNFQEWQKRKQQECRRITDAAAFLVPQGNGGHSSALTAVLERASSARR